MVKKSDVSVPEISLCRSWQWVHPDFTAQWEYLCGGTGENGNEIWRTKFKDVKLLSVPSPNGAYRIAFKSYREKRLLRYFMRPSLAAREAEGFRIAEALNIPVAQVLAFGEKRCFMNLCEAFFITRFEENTETLLYFCQHLEERAELLALLKENIIRLGQLHSFGYTHGGAHPRNFLWRRNAAGELESLWIDLATVRKKTGGKKWWKYLLTDLSDFVELFKLSQDELDSLMAEYRKYNDIPAAYKLRTDHEYKFSAAVLLH